MKPSDLYKQKKLHLVAVVLVLIGGLNWLSVLFMKKDLVQKIFGYNFFTKIIYLLVGVSSLYLFFQRDTYLPFLGETLVPCAAFSTRTPDNANLEVSVQVTPNTKIVYWASEPSKGTDASENRINAWDKAYNDYSNSGVAMSDDKGKAILHVRGKPQAYSVPFKGMIESHVHFRICGDNGILGPVKTIFIDSGRIENFKNYI
jgi:uncharacterized membrane protein YuzA (DUF378 family)